MENITSARMPSYEDPQILDFTKSYCQCLVCSPHWWINAFYLLEYNNHIIRPTTFKFHLRYPLELPCFEGPLYHGELYFCEDGQLRGPSSFKDFLFPTLPSPSSR
eukprot:TRINITY_DN17220_c0_g1_i1.p1 TRINITY_DN17220_c0_g1~~TRINITY_DN17220_c0_g1_i1.p1  ORF type:complete len:105 (-),score=11.38 TRINITY_DN17220_c0_g1_i1:105-419(-)